MIAVKTIRKPKTGNGSGGGSGTGSGFANAGSSGNAEKADYASQAGNAETAEYASRAGTAGVAEGLAQSVWTQIDEKDAAALNAAKEYANGNFLSKKNNDTAQGFISFLAGIGIGPAETWGYVKKVTENGVEKVKSWFKNLWTDVLTVSAYIKGENGTVNIESNLYGTGSAEFDGDLYAEGGIHSGGDVVADNNIYGVDGRFSRDVDVKGTVTTQNLKVTGIAEFFKLIIDELRAAGGAQLYTAADGFAVEAVTRFEYDGGHRRRLWWRATDGTKATQNKWVQGMQAVCMNFNAVTAPGQYDNVSNHQFWAVVAWCGTATGENGAGTTPEWNNSNPAYVPGETNPYEVTHWHFIDLYCGETASSIDTSTNNEYKRLWKGDIYNVAVGDEIAMLGYRPNLSDYVNGELSEDARRLQSAVYISAYSSYDDGLKAPFLAFYQGIDDFDLSSHRKTYIDAFGSKFYGDFFAESNSEGLAGLLSTLEVGVNGIRSEVSSIPVSRNLLLNTDFTEENNYLPTYWEAWGNPLDISIGAVIREKWNYVRIRPGSQYDGIMQNSKVLSGGVWKKVLKHGGTYTMSLWACTNRPDGTTNRADILIHIMNVDSQGNVSNPVGVQPHKNITLTRDWQRVAVQFTVSPSGHTDTGGYAFRVMIGCYHDNVPSDEEILISRPQLEESTPMSGTMTDLDTATEWRRGEENAALMSTRIVQLADQISLAVYKDNLEKAGVHIEYDENADEGRTTLKGDRIVVNGDLDLQGLTTENVRIVGRNPYIPTVVNMGVGVASADEVVKSVQVKIGEYDRQNHYQSSHHVVVLPFYDSAFQNWSSENLPTGNFKTDVPVTDPLFGSFNILPQSINTGYATVQVSDCERRVVQWRKNGTRLTIANEHDPKRANWKDIERWGNWGNDNYGATSRQYVAELLKHAVVVCADARLLAHWNIVQNNPYSAGYGEGDTHATGDGGTMSCNGHKARFILLLPGQTLQLRSQILDLGNERKVLTWLVENPSEFVPMTFGINVKKISGGYEQGVASALRSRSSACYIPLGGNNAVTEVMLGAALVNLTVSQSSPNTNQADSWTQKIGVEICVN